MKPQDGTPLPDDTLLSDVVLTGRAEHVAGRAGLKTVGDLRRMSDAELMALPDCGRMTLLEFRLLTGQYQIGKPSKSDQAMKQQWVREIRWNTFKGSFEDYRKEHGQ